MNRFLVMWNTLMGRPEFCPSCETFVDKLYDAVFPENPRSDKMAVFKWCAMCSSGFDRIHCSTVEATE